MPERKKNMRQEQEKNENYIRSMHYGRKEIEQLYSSSLVRSLRSTWTSKAEPLECGNLSVIYMYFVAQSTERKEKILKPDSPLPSDLLCYPFAILGKIVAKQLE